MGHVSVLKTVQGQAMFVSSGELETGWGTANRLVYTLPAELLAKLDGLAEAQWAGWGARPSLWTMTLTAPESGSQEGSL